MNWISVSLIHSVSVSMTSIRYLAGSSWPEPCEYGNDPVEQAPGFGVLFRGEDAADFQDILHGGAPERRTSGDLEGSSPVAGSRLAVAFRDVNPHFSPACCCESALPRVYCVALEKRAQRTVKYASARFPSRALYPHDISASRYTTW